MNRMIPGPRSWKPPVEPREQNWTRNLNVPPEFDWISTNTKGIRQTLELSAESHAEMVDGVEQELLLLRNYDNLPSIRRRLSLRLRMFESAILHGELADEYLAEAACDADANDEGKWAKIQEANTQNVQRLNHNRKIIEDLKEQILRCDPNAWRKAQEG